jgi:hypothetical protein
MTLTDNHTQPETGRENPSSLPPVSHSQHPSPLLYPSHTSPHIITHQPTSAHITPQHRYFKIPSTPLHVKVTGQQQSALPTSLYTLSLIPPPPPTRTEQGHCQAQPRKRLTKTITAMSTASNKHHCTMGGKLVTCGCPRWPA